MTVADSVTSGAAVSAEASVVVTGVPAVLDDGALAVPLITFGSTSTTAATMIRMITMIPIKMTTFFLLFGLRGSAVRRSSYAPGGVGWTPLVRMAAK